MQFAFNLLQIALTIAVCFVRIAICMPLEYGESNESRYLFSLKDLRNNWHRRSSAWDASAARRNGRSCWVSEQDSGLATDNQGPDHYVAGHFIGYGGYWEQRVGSQGCTGL
jgi:hypothetical protein